MVAFPWLLGDAVGFPGCPAVWTRRVRGPFGGRGRQRGSEVPGEMSFQKGQCSWAQGTCRLLLCLPASTHRAWAQGLPDIGPRGGGEILAPRCALQQLARAGAAPAQRPLCSPLPGTSPGRSAFKSQGSSGRWYHFKCGKLRPKEVNEVACSWWRGLRGIPACRQQLQAGRLACEG